MANREIPEEKLTCKYCSTLDYFMEYVSEIAEQMKGV